MFVSILIDGVGGDGGGCQPHIATSQLQCVLALNLRTCANSSWASIGKRLPLLQFSLRWPWLIIVSDWSIQSNTHTHMHISTSAVITALAQEGKKIHQQIVPITSIHTGNGSRDKRWVGQHWNWGEQGVQARTCASDEQPQLFHVFYSHRSFCLTQISMAVIDRFGGHQFFIFGIAFNFTLFCDEVILIKSTRALSAYFIYYYCYYYNYFCCCSVIMPMHWKWLPIWRCSLAAQQFSEEDWLPMNWKNRFEMNIWFMDSQLFE